MDTNKPVMVPTYQVFCDKCGFIGAGRGEVEDGNVNVRVHEQHNAGHTVTVKKGPDVPAQVED